MKKTFKVSQFINKSDEVIVCSIDDTIDKAKSLMLLNDFSQIPVLDNNRKIFGAISWKSIGKNEAVGKNNEKIIDYLEEPAIVKENGDFLDYIKLIAKKDYILVTDDSENLLGIITTYDMTIQFKEFIIPFLKLGIIEDSIREIIRQRNIPTQKDVHDLTYGEYIKIFTQEENWNNLNLKNIDKEVFINKIDEIRKLRNKIAHYKPGGINNSEKFVINSFADIIQKFNDYLK
ncbi:CBS domain-containing protein [Chryseobacterium sp. MIQD13]|uniref:CBS domain-containing protein n=1 Tax=Chryseobacterium sp. MIQD13 TaxID=3422310 RepID=UPI003D2B09E2